MAGRCSPRIAALAIVDPMLKECSCDVKCPLQSARTLASRCKVGPAIGGSGPP